MNILILGYYNRNNLGDDLFKLVFGNILSHNLTFSNPDDIKKIPENTDIVIVGGGDLINDYFMNKIRSLVNNTRIPVYAIGVGFPYIELATPEYVNIFDVIITRTKCAYDKLKDKVPIFYEPDLVYSMDFPRQRAKKSTIGFFFANSICEPHSNLVQKLVDIVQHVASIPGTMCGSKKYNVELYSMNTSGAYNEDDRYLNDAIVKKVNMPNVSFVDTFDVSTVFSKLAGAVCTRFHSHVLCRIFGVPFVSLYSTQKVKDLLVTENLLDFGEEMDVDIKLKPVSINAKSVIRKFESLDKFPKRGIPSTATLLQGIQNLLFYKPRFGEKLYKYVSYKASKIDSQDEAKAITFVISKCTEKDYTWGLRENIKNPRYNKKEGIKWILANQPREFTQYYNNTPFADRKYNVLHFDGPLSKNVHRSGWAYVVDGLSRLHNPQGIIVDTYLDKTFGWEREFFESIGYIPIKKSWIGFFHHTFDDLHSSNNLLNIIRCKSFQDSLKYCMHIVVLSEYLKTQLQKYVCVPIHVLYHPTEFVDMTWKKCTGVVNIGAWLRDPYAIYSLPRIKYPKKILKGHNMDNYFPPCDFLKNLQSGLCIDYVSCNGISRDVCNRSNKFVIGFIDDIIKKMKDVQILCRLSNSEYDDLMVNNVVFLKLIDASACNTLIECIVRGTPIVINKIPAVVEYLGKDYPLYYETLDDAASLINNDALIQKAHRYLMAKDKKFLSLDYFLQRFSSL